MKLSEYINSLEERIATLENPKYTKISCAYCDFCGQLDTRERALERLAEHIKVCERHPLREVEETVKRREAVIDLLEAENRRLKGALTVLLARL